MDLCPVGQAVSVESLAGVGLDRVALVGVLALGVLHNFEPPARVLSGVGQEVGAVVLAVRADAEAGAGGLHHEGDLRSVLEDSELLAASPT